MLLLLALFAGSSLAVFQPVAAAVTTNCSTVNGVPTATCTNAGSNAATNIGSQRKVFFANGYWWIFWASGTNNGIYYQSCPGSLPTSCNASNQWSSPTSFTTVGQTTTGAFQSGVVFSAQLVGTTLFYVDAPAPTTSTDQTFYWGAVTLAATGTVQYLVTDQAVSFSGLGLYGVNTPRVSISVDGNGYLWISMVTSTASNTVSPYYITTLECTTNVTPTPTAGACSSPSNWDSSSFKLLTTSTSFFTAPTLLNVTYGGSPYMALAYIDSQNGGVGGYFDIYYAKSGLVSGSAISWAATCGSASTSTTPTPCQTVSNSYSSGANTPGVYYSAAASGSTVYVVSMIAQTAMNSFTYTLGQSSDAGYDNFLTGLNTNYDSTLSISGSQAVLTYVYGNNVEFQYDLLTNFATGSGWSAVTNLAAGTEQGPGWADASATSYSIDGYQLVGVIWANTVTNPSPTTQQVRFGVISMSNSGIVDFPVTITISLYEYTSPTSTHFQVSASNYFLISYVQESGAGATVQYTSNSGAPLVISNVQSYSTWDLYDQSSASTGPEVWCVLYGGNCNQNSQTAFSASNGVTLSLYYFDQLAQNKLYAVAVPSVLSLWADGTCTSSASCTETTYATVNYDTSTAGSPLSLGPQSGGSVLYPNPLGTSGSQFAYPRGEIYSSGGYDTYTQWARTRDVIAGCSSLTTYPVPSPSSCAPSVSFGATGTPSTPLYVGYSASVTPPAAVLAYVPIVLTNAQSSATPSGFQQMVSVDSARFAGYEASKLQNVEFFTASGAIIPSWLESGNSNTSTSTVYWLNLGTNTIPAGTAASPGTLTVYMGFVSTLANLLSASGSTGEAPQLSPSYGLYDNGPHVFTTYYTNFNGTSLPGYFSTANTEQPGNTVAVDNGITISTSASNLWGGIVLGEAFTTPTTMEADVTELSGSASGFMASTGTLSTSLGYGYNFWGGSTDYGGFNVGQSSTNSPRMSMQSGVMGIAWPSTGTEYYYTNYALSTGSDSHVSQTGSVYYSFGEYTGSKSSVLGMQWVRVMPTAPDGVMPTATVGPATTSTPANGVKILDYVPITLTNNMPSITPPYFQVDVNVTSSTYAKYEASGLQNVGFFTWSGTPGTNGTLMPSWLESGASNTASNSVYWVADPSMIAGSGGTQQVYMGFASTGTSFFQSQSGYYNPYVGEAPTLSPSYGLYDNGANVFNFYSNFAGTSLPPTWAALSSIGNTQTESVAIGQLCLATVGICSTNDVANQGLAVGASGLSGATSVAFDSHGDMWVADTANNRILEYTTPYFSGKSASLVIGQSSFSGSGSGSTSSTLNGPTSLAFDSSGNLWVADTGNNRVMEFKAPFSNGEAASLSIGGSGAVSATTLNSPHGIAFDSSGNLWVSDTSNNRVLGYAAPLSAGEAATFVIGQSSLMAGSPNQGLGSPTAQTLSSPYGLSFDSSGNLWVSDTSNNRVLEFPFSSLATTDPAATDVLGQSETTPFTTATAGTTSTTLKGPTGIAFDKWGELWVADTGNNRVLGYSQPYSGTFQVGQAASYYIGQFNFNSGNANQGLAAPNAQTLSGPTAVAFDSNDAFWVADTGNNRVVGTGAGATDAVVSVNNGVAVQESGGVATGILTTVGINPTVNILETDTYFSNTNTQNQVMGYAVPSTSTPVPSLSRLYTIEPYSLSSVLGYGLWNGGSPASSLISQLTEAQLPPGPPSMSYTLTENACTGSSNVLYGGVLVPSIDYPATCTTNGAALATVAGVTWIVKNTTVSVTPTISGAFDEQWAAPGSLSWTITSPYQMTTSIPYYHQYDNTFIVKSGGKISSIPSGIAFTATGTLYGQQNKTFQFTSTTTTQTQWFDAGTVVKFPADGSGAASGVRWENSNNQSQTVVINTAGGCTALCTATYYEQYQQYTQYSTSDGSAIPSTQTLEYNYTSFGQTATAVIPKVAGSGPTPSVWVDALTLSNATSIVRGSQTTEVTSSVTSATPTSVTDSTAAWTPGQWVGYYVYFSSGADSGQWRLITANTATSLSFATALPHTPVAGDGYKVVFLSERWVLPNATQTITKPYQLLNPMIYYHQYDQQMAHYVTSDGLPITSASTPKLSILVNGTAVNVQLNATSSGNVFVWADAGKTDTATAVLPGASGEQWVPAISGWLITGTNVGGGAGGIGSFAAGLPDNASVVFDHQFQTTYETVPTDPGFSITICSYPVSVCSVPVTYTTGSTPPLGTAVWQTTPYSVSIASSNPTYIPTGIGATAGICLKTGPPYTGPCSSLTSSSSAEAFATSEGTVTGYFNLQEGVTFIQTGIFESPSDQTTWTVTVTNSTGHWSGASSSSALSITLVCKTSCTYTYVVQSPVYNAADNARYFVTASEATGTFTLTSTKSSTSESLTFNPQYLLQIVSDPLYTGAFTGTYTNSSGSPSSGTIPGSACSGGGTCYAVSLWLMPGSTANFGTSVANPGIFGSNPPTWLDWSGTGCPTAPSPACTSEASVTVSAMTAPVTLAANFQTSLSLDVNPSSESAYIGETVTTNAYIFGGVGNVTIGAVVPPGLVGLISITFYPLSTPTDQANPLTIPSSAYGGPSGTSPIGQTIVMMVQVSSHATLYGALNFTVTATSTGLPWVVNSGAQAVCTTTGQLNCIYTLDIISPKATVIGNAQTPFAVTTPGQSSLFYDASNGGHWIAFYYNGSASSGFLVYASSKDANGTIWNAPQRVPSGDAVQGYQYAVTVNNGYVYYVLASNATLPTTGSTQRWSFFFWNWGQVQSNGLIDWNWNAANKCTLVSEACIHLIPGGGSTAYVAGQPGIAIGPVTGDVYVSIPTLQTSGGSLMWRVDVWYSPPAPSMSPSPDTWQFAGSTTPRSVSAVNTKIFALTNSIALVDWVGNDLSLPYVTVLNDPPPPVDMLECSPSSAGAASPAQYALYGAQSDVIANGNTLYFAGVNATNSVVNFYTYTYGSSACGSGVNGGWSSVSQIAVGAPTNKLSDWHVSLSWSSGSIIIGYGVDSQLGFVIGTESGSTWSWFVLPSVQGLSGIQGGLTAAFAPSGSGSGSVGMIWVQKISTSRYAVEFALA